jgi:hypothetical protein
MQNLKYETEGNEAGNCMHFVYRAGDWYCLGHSSNIVMKKNMHNIDRVLRVTFAAVVAILIATQVLTGLFAVVLGVLGGVFLATSLVGFCPLYALFGISTCKTA